MAKLFEVLVDRRNAVVLEHLGRLLEEEPGVARVAVFFGAAHMPALERGGVAELGLEPVAESWLTAVDLRFDDMSLPRGQIRFLRRTIRRVLDQQLDR